MITSFALILGGDDELRDTKKQTHSHAQGVGNTWVYGCDMGGSYMGSKLMNDIYEEQFIIRPSKLRDEREKRGMTQTEFADINLVTKRTVINWEQGATHPDEKDLFWMKKKLKLPIDTMK